MSATTESLSRQQEAELRLHENQCTYISRSQNHIVNYQNLHTQVRISDHVDFKRPSKITTTTSPSRSLQTTISSNHSIITENCFSKQATKKPFRRRSCYLQNQIMISNNDNQPSTSLSLPPTQVTDSAIDRLDGTNHETMRNFKSPFQHRGRGQRPSAALSLSNPSSSSSSLLLLPISLTLVIVILVNLISLSPINLVTANNNVVGNDGLTQQQQQQQQQQLNSVIQPPTSPATSNGKARYKTLYACEDRLLTMDCDYGSKINLIRANFGRFSITQCNERGELDLSTDCMSPITFRIMRDRCQDNQMCSVNASSAIFGDRCPKTRKYLEVHFQCQPDPRVNVGAYDTTDRVDLRNTSHSISSNVPQALPQPNLSATTSILPPNNPTHRLQQQHQHQPQPQPQPQIEPIPTSFEPNESRWPSMKLPASQQAATVINSAILTYNDAINIEIALNKFQDPASVREPIVVPMKHRHIENIFNPRCVLWDNVSSQWTERGSQILSTNQTHTICAFDQATSYMLVMDHMQASPSSQSSLPQMISPIPSTPHRPITSDPYLAGFASPVPGILDKTPEPLDPQHQSSINNNSQDSPIANNINSSSSSSRSFISNTNSGSNNNNNNNNNRSFSFASYLLVGLFLAVALMTLVFVASSLRNSPSSAGAAFKSLGNFAVLNGGNGASKCKHRRQDMSGPGSSLHSSNKDLLVINNSNGHQFLYAPASTTKINSSSSTHILSATLGGHQNSNGQPTHHQGTLHRVQQQMYSGNGATLSSLSAAGTQSNNYYYGLLGPNPLFQQQQQQHQQHQQSYSQQQTPAHGYSHQANKSTVSTESAQSSSSSGVESGSASIQQQQPQAQRACLVSTSGGIRNDFNLIASYGQAQQNPFGAPNNGSSHPPFFTVNAHYSTAGIAQPINGSGQQQQLHYQHQRQLSNNQLRDHIYETVDFVEKPYMSRLLMPMNISNEQPSSAQFATIGHHHQQQHQQQQHNQQRESDNTNSRVLGEARVCV